MQVGIIRWSYGTDSKVIRHRAVNIKQPYDYLYVRRSFLVTNIVWFDRENFTRIVGTNI